MTETPEQTAEKIAARGREALISRLRPAFEEAAAAHSDVLKLGPEQIESMVQRAADRADGLQWRRALAHVATEELGISLGEALSHPSVARAHEIVGAPSYEDSLAELGPIGTRATTRARTPPPSAPAPPPAPEPLDEPGPAAETEAHGEPEPEPDAAAEAPDEPEPEPDAQTEAHGEPEPEPAAEADIGQDEPAETSDAGDDEDHTGDVADAGDATAVDGDEPLRGWDDAPGDADAGDDAYEESGDAPGTEAQAGDAGAAQGDPAGVGDEAPGQDLLSAPAWGSTEGVSGAGIPADLGEAGFASDAELSALGGETQAFPAPELPDDPAPVAAPGGATAEYSFEEFDDEFYDDGLRISVIHLGGIANLEPAESNIELLMSADGLDIIRGGNDVLGRLEWDQVKALEVPVPRSRRRMRRPGPTHLVIRTARGDASFEVPDVSPAELRQHLGPVIDDHIRRS